MYSTIHSSTVYNSQAMEETQVSINRWKDKENVVYVYIGILAIKKNEITPFATTQMDQKLSY